MTKTTTHQISFDAPQTGIAFRVFNSILVLSYLRTYFPSQYPSPKGS